MYVSVNEGGATERIAKLRCEGVGGVKKICTKPQKQWTPSLNCITGILFGPRNVVTNIHEQLVL
jgi:hypothetical protein